MRKRAPADPDEVTLLPGMAQFYALLPYAVKGVRVTAPASVRQGEPVAIGIQLDVKKGKAGDHVIRVETRDPSGTPVYYYSANLVSAKGAASYTINLPLNAALGTWRVTATDLPSGKEQSVDVRVEAGDRAAPSVNPPAGAGPTDAAAGQASKGPARDAWGGAPRSPRETFTPQTNQVPFNLNGSILKNPALIEVGAPGEAPRHWEGIMLQESGHSAKEPYAKLVRIEQDPSTPFMDQPSIKVTLGATDEEKTLLEIRQIIPKSDVRGKKVRLTFYAYRENPPAGREFWIRSVFVDANGVAKGSGFTVTPRIPAGTWVRCFAEGAVDPESAALKVSLVGHFSGKPDTFWFSGFRLEAVE
jgi:hypothetical protein